MRTSMTDNEIIKALECCLSGKDYDTACMKCPIEPICESDDILLKYALDLINRQKAENERLEKELELANADKVIAETHEKSAKEMFVDVTQQIKTATSEAIKECIAKVKNHIKTHCNPYGKPDFDYDTSIKILNFIDNLVKEITE